MTAASLLVAAPAQSQVLNRPSEGSSAIRVAQWQPSPVPSESASLPSPAQTLDSQTLDRAIAVGEPQGSSPVLTPVITKVYSHQVDEQDAVTLYVRDIPVLTFLANGAAESTQVPQTQAFQATSQTTSQATSQATVLPPSQGVAAPDTVSPYTPSQPSALPAPMERAQNVAQKLEAVYGELTQASAIAGDIRLEWSEQDNKYWITAGDRPLVALDKWTIAVEPSANLTSDSIRTTNQLRRLIHNGAPLSYGGYRHQTNPAVQVAVAAPPSAPEALLGGSVRSTQYGIASWYGGYFHGRRTANGERYNQNAMTAAHKHLPFGTRVRVVNLANGRSTIVRINDRGPFIRGRIIDLSSAAAGEIGLRSRGIGRVRVEVLR